MLVEQHASIAQQMKRKHLKLIIKIFNALQEKRANKHLLYVSKASQRIHCFFSCTFLFTYGGRC